METKFTVKKIALIGIMAAFVFAACKISIPIPISIGGVTRIHLGNSVILLSALILGGKGGGFAAAIGAFMFDMLDPLFIPSAPFTFFARFIMAWFCGTIAHSKGKNGRNFEFNLIATVSASLTYIIIYLTKSFFETLAMVKGFWQAFSLVISGSLNLTSADFAIAFTSGVLPRAGASLVNAIFGVAISVPLCFTVRKALAKANLSID